MSPLARITLQTSFTKTYHKFPYPAIDPAQKSLSAAGKTVLITAGGTGIGYAIAQNFGIAGASHVILLARRNEVLVKAVSELASSYPGTHFHHFAASITDEATINDVFVKIRSGIAEPDILVAGATLPGQPSPSLDAPAEEIRLMFETNVFGNMNLVREFLGRLDSGKQKTIIDVSTLVTHIYLPQMSSYSVTKATFTHWLSHVYGDNKDKNLRIHSIHPGSVLTDAARAFGMTEKSQDWDDVQLPGQFVVWLASKEAEFLNGRFLWANWDVEELKARKRQFEADSNLLTIGLM